MGGSCKLTEMNRTCSRPRLRSDRTISLARPDLVGERDRPVGVPQPPPRAGAIHLGEPARTAKRRGPRFSSASALDREPSSSCWTGREGQTYEAIVSLTSRRITTWRHVPDTQPNIIVEEFLECERACRANADWQAAMRKRGITDFDLCMVDPWSNGNYGIDGEHDNGRRLVRALTWVAPTRKTMATPGPSKM